MLSKLFRPKYFIPEHKQVCMSSVSTQSTARLGELYSGIKFLQVVVLWKFSLIIFLRENYIYFCNACFTYLLFVCISKVLAVWLSTCSQAVAFQGTV